MNGAEQSIQLLAALAERLRDNPQFMAHALDVYQRRAGLSDAEMARALGATPEMLARLALCHRPASGAPDFAEQARELADYTLIDEARLASVIRQANSLIESSPHAGRLGSFAGAMAAIRRRVRAFEPRPLLIAAGAICAMTIVLTGLLVWQTKREPQAPIIARRAPEPVGVSPFPATPLASTPAAPQPRATMQASPEMMAEVHVKLPDYSTLRDMAEAGRGDRKPIKLPASRARIVIELPERSVKGLYRVSIADADGAPLKTAKERSSDGKTLTIILNLRELSGKASSLSVGRVDETPHFYPVVIGNSKATSNQ